MKVVLMGLEFSINNLGCEALSYSFVAELYAIAKKQGMDLDISTIVFADRKVPYIPGTDIPVRCIKISYKSIAFWKEIKKEFKNSDMIFDFTMGDSFSDIYGMKRFSMDALVKTLAIKSGKAFILGPQTYGPYKNAFVKKWSTWILKNATQVYTRDSRSKEVAESMTGKKVYLTTDVAFALPYEVKKVSDTDKIRVGLNPSGLLWKGGYTENNQFGLTIDYQKYCMDVCKWLSENPKYELYLIPHVGTETVKDDECEGRYENDGAVCRLIRKTFPDATILDGFMTPMDAKGYIAAMDVFIGARMHATIGAFSSGVATIPVSYSRKFEGLYGSLDYEYVIHAIEDSTEDAVAKTIDYIENYETLKTQVAKSMNIVKEKQQVFRDHLLDSVIQNGK